MHLGHIVVVLLWMDHTGLPEIRAINYNYKCLCLGHIEGNTLELWLHTKTINKYISVCYDSLPYTFLLLVQLIEFLTSINSVNLSLPALFCQSV